MRRLSLISFGALVVASAAAFFVTQHLKVSTPLIAGFPRPVPGVIDPYGAKCGGVDHTRMRISFYLLHRSDVVDVYMVDSSGTIVRTLASDLHMSIKRRRQFYWNGRTDNGEVAPDGTYYVRVALHHQGRTVDISDSSGPIPVKVKTIPPHPVVTAATPSLIPAGHQVVTITYRGTEQRSGIVRLYRTDLPGTPLVKSFKTPWHSSQARWDGLIRQAPAAAGTYLVGLDVTDAACNVGKFPPLLPPTPGSTPHAGVTVRYLAAEPPLMPVAAGSRALVYVDARREPYRWTLWRAGARKPSGHGAQRAVELRVKLPPAQGAGLYHLVITSGRNRTDVPLIASYPSARAFPHVVVVLPMLTWQGQNPVDDDFDGVPNTLTDGGPIKLSRVFANGLPQDYYDEAAFLSYLDRAHLPYDLTTDLALINGAGPPLSGHTGLVLAGPERWAPPALASTLRSYVLAGGQVMSLGTDSLLRGVTVRGDVALHPTALSATDPLGARPGPLVTHSSDLITVIRDSLHIFSATSGVFQGYAAFQPLRSVAAPATVLSAAGTTSSTPAVVGYRLGKGLVVDVGLVAFGSSLAHNVDAKELVQAVWKLLRH